MAIKRNNRLKANLKLRLFFSFLILAVTFWVLINLSKTYSDEVEFAIDYTRLPVDKELQNSPPKSLIASVESSGFNLLKYKLSRRKIQLDVSNLAHDKGTLFYYLPNTHLFEINAQFSVDTRIDKIKLDTIFLDLGVNISKKVPIQLLEEVQFKLGYNFSDGFKIIPDSVTVIGPQSIIDTIDNVNTHVLNLTEVFENINAEVELQEVPSSKVSFDISAITVSAQVDKFTEGSFKVPFELLNVPEGKSLTTFPSEVEIVYQIGLRDFKKITAKDFEVYCDFEYALENDLNYLVPKLRTISALVSNVKIVPDKIEFLIQE